MEPTRKKIISCIMHKGKYYLTLYFIPQKLYKVFFSLSFLEIVLLHPIAIGMAEYEWWPYNMLTIQNSTNFDMNESKKIVNKWRVITFIPFSFSYSLIQSAVPCFLSFAVSLALLRWATRNITSKIAILLWAKKEKKKNEFISTLW